MDDEDFDVISVPQLLLAGFAAFTILGVAIVWNAVSLTASAVQTVKYMIGSSEPHEL